MFRTRYSVALAAAFTLTSLAGEGAAAPGQAPTPEQIIAARQAGYDMSVGVINEMKLAVAAGQDVKKQFYVARGLERWTKVLPTLFPAGTEPGATSVETHALPVVWTD